MLTNRQRIVQAKVDRGDQCMWVLLCDNLATTTRPHPILGDVDICDRCNTNAERLSSPRS